MLISRQAFFVGHPENDGTITDIFPDTMFDPISFKGKKHAFGNWVVGGIAEDQKERGPGI